MKSGYTFIFSFAIYLVALSSSVNAADWQRTTVFILGQTQTGQDMFVRGGIDHNFALSQLGRNCTQANKLCAIPIRHLNLKNATTAPWKSNDTFLDWYGTETNQSTAAQGTPSDWTINTWPSSWGTKKTVAIDGFGEEPLNLWGAHYWMMDVLMDCSATVNGWFELKSFISNGPGWEPNVAQSGTPYSSGNHFAQCGKINKFERGSNTALIIPFPGTNKVFIQVDKTNDYVHLFVNGIERMNWAKPKLAPELQLDIPPARINEKIDITYLLAQGNNEIKIVSASDNWGWLLGGYSIQLWTDDNLIMNDQQDFNIGGNFQGIIYEKKININLNSGLPPKNLMVTAINGGDAIYINNRYTGKTAPATFTLPQGEYRIGVGSSNVTPLPNNDLIVFGQYRETDIVLGDHNVTIHSSDLPVMNTPNEWKVAIVPYTNVHNGLTLQQALSGMPATPDNIGTLTADDIVVAEHMVKTVSDKWLLPMSYGLMKWNITVLPPITQKVYRPFNHDILIDLVDFGRDMSQYDLVIHIKPNFTEMGTRVTHDVGGGGAGPFNAFIPSDWLTAHGNNLAERLNNLIPHPGLLHESLHNIDQYRFNEYNGIEQLHGAEEHGFANNDCGISADWVCWYMNYIRSQIGENTTTRNGIPTTQKISSTNASLFVGVFNVMRYGKNAQQLWSYSKPISRLQNISSSACSDLSNTQEGSLIIATSCSTNANQQWSFQHTQNGAYMLVNQNTHQCAEFTQGEFRQKSCNFTLNQRFIIQNINSSSFQIKTLNGVCLGINIANNSFIADACNANQLNQQWQFN